MLGITALGIVLLAAGLFLYGQVAPQWQQAQGWFVQIAGAVSPAIQHRVENIRMLYFGSIGAIWLGAILTVVGLLSPRQAPREVPAGEATTPKPWYELTTGSWRIPVTVLGIIVVVLIIQGSNTQLGSPPASTPVSYRPLSRSTAQPITTAPTAPVADQQSAQEDPRRVFVRKAAGDLQLIRDLEWSYFQQNGRFSRNLTTIGFSSDSRSLFAFSVPRLTSSQVTVIAKGRLFTSASGLRMIMMLNDDGTSRFSVAQ